MTQDIRRREPDQRRIIVRPPRPDARRPRTQISRHGKPALVASQRHAGHRYANKLLREIPCRLGQQAAGQIPAIACDEVIERVKSDERHAGIVPEATNLPLLTVNKLRTSPSNRVCLLEYMVKLIAFPVKEAESKMSTLTSGDRVIHPNQQEWGVGKVLSATPENLDVFFVGAGRKRLSRSFIQLEKAEGAASKHRLLDNLIETSQIVSDDFVTPAMAIERFMRNYPDGFEDPAFIKATREANLRGHKFCTQLLSQEEITRLIADGCFDMICERALHVESTTNLLTKSERKALQEALELPACQKLFSIALADLLYGSETEETRFKHFLRTLGILHLNKWPFATLFSFIRHPQQCAFIKPTAIQKSAKALCWRINYKPEPNWKTYDAVLRLYSYIRTNLLEEGMMPRDLIDVQSFIWSIGQK